ncbi:MAG: hypothetical protein HUN04_12495 [Desulfobacter sp.]|nr:MAG: hypothetical protein HUN04_12495 [Desulfobacter sp.]
MDNNRSTPSWFFDSAILITTITAILFIIGYLHEVPFLEKFGLSNEELLPSSTQFISIGFKYIYTKYFTHFFVLTSLLMVFSITILSVQDLLFHWFKNKLKIQETIKTIKILFRMFLFTIPLFMFLFSYRVLKDGANEFAEYQNVPQQKTFDLLYTPKYPNGLKGKVIRYYGNKIAFFDVKQKIAIVVPDSQIIELKYSVRSNMLKTKVESK